MSRRNGIFTKIGILCLALVLAVGSLGIGYAAWSDTVTIDGTVTTGSWEVGGSPGLWKNWDKHNTYTETEIEAWLSSIDGSSDWLVPDMDEDGAITISDMEAVFIAGQGGTMEQKFLRHYLATRLNVEAGRLSLGTFHLFSSYDTGDYLGLGGQGDLGLIIGAIESKYGTPPTEESPSEDWPTEDEFQIMKNICDALNSLAI